MEFIRLASAELGRASMRLAANGASKSNGYAGKIQIGVMVWIGNVLAKRLAMARELGDVKLTVLTR
jgi:hypothetical protein